MVDIVPNVSVLSFGNDTIRNTVPTLFRYIGKDNDKTIKRHTLAKGPGDTRCNTSIILHTYQVPRVHGVYRVVRVYGQHVHYVSVDFIEWYGYMASTSGQHCVAYNLFLSCRSCALAVA